MKVIAFFQALAGTGESAPFGFAITLVQIDFNFDIAATPMGPGRSCADQRSRNNLGVVEHQQITGLKQIRKVEDALVFQVSSFDMQQPRAIPWPRRAQGNPVFRKLEVKVGEFHGRGR